MKKKILWTILILLSATGIAYGVLHFFSASSKHLSLIPKDAQVVFRIDFKSIYDKLDYEGEFKKTDVYKYFEKSIKESNRGDKNSAVFTDILKNPMSSGINLFSSTYLFLFNKENTSYAGFVADIRDKGNFNRTIQKIPDVNGQIKKTKDFYFVHLGKKSVLAWNEKGLLMLSEVGFSLYDDDEKENVEVIANDLMLQSRDSSIGSLKEFEDFAELENDLSLFANYESVINTFGNSGNEIDTAISESLKGIYMNSGLNFMQDSIVFKVHYSGDKKKLEEMNYLKDKGINPELLGYKAFADPLAFLSINLDTDKIKKLLDKFKGFKELKNEFSYDEVLNALSGEGFLAVSDIEIRDIEQTQYYYDEAGGGMQTKRVTVPGPYPVLAFYLGLRDKSVFRNFISRFPKDTTSELQAIVLPGFEGSRMYILEKGKGVYLCNDYILAQQLNAGGTSIKSILSAEGISHSFYMNIKLDPARLSPELVSFMSEEMGPSYKQFEDYMSMFTDIKAGGSGINAGLSINMKPGQGNSLFRLFKQMDKLKIFD